MGKILIVIIVFVMQFSFAQDLLPVYEGKAKPKFELVWEIGNGESEDDILLDRPRKLRLDKGGNLYFIEAKENVIKKFDQEGNFIKTIGRTGEGPGEFKSCFRLMFDEDGNYYVYDFWLRRVSKFNSKDEFVKSFKFDQFIYGYSALPENKFALQFVKRDIKGEYSYENHIHSIFNNKFEVTKTLDSTYVKSNRLKKVGNNVSSMTIVFRTGSDILSLPNGNIFSTNSDNYITKVYSTKGELISKEKIGVKRKPVTEKDKEKTFAEFLKDPNAKNFKDMIEFNEYKPYYDFVIQDADGYILIRTDNEEKPEFDIFSPEGKFIIKTELPEKYFNHNSLVTNRHIYTIETNDDDIRIIRKYKIIL